MARKPDFFKDKPTTYHSKKHEKSVAKRTGTRRVPGSGNQPGSPGDVAGRKFLRECKTTSKAGFLLGSTILSKACQEALAVNRTPLIEVEVRGVKPPVPSRWVVVPAEVFDDLVGEQGA